MANNCKRYERGSCIDGDNVDKCVGKDVCGAYEPTAEKVKLYRHHRDMLKDSLATTCEVSGIEELRQYLTHYWSGHVSDILILKRKIEDWRLPKEWGGVSYEVIAEFADGGWGCIGMTNFYEE